MRNVHSIRSTRPAVERMRHIARLLRHAHPMTASDVARDFEVGRKTIQRDMTFMRDRLGWDFTWSPVAGSFVLSKAPEAVL